MRRRDFLGVLTSIALFDQAEAQGGPARVGVLGDPHLVVEAFTSELRALAREGSQIDIDLRLTEGKADRYASLARELIEQKPNVIFVYGTQALTALQAATGSVPVVAVVGDVGAALASESLRRPTNNVTGLTTLANQTSAKRLEFLKELVPAASHLGVLIRVDNPANFDIAGRMRPVADRLGVKVTAFNLDNDVGTSLEAAQEAGVHGLLVGADPSFFVMRDLIVAEMTKRRIPAIYSVRDYVLAGGLMSYAPDYAELGRRAARYVDRILKGAHPSDLPIQQAERFELLVNLKAAAALGIKVSPGLLVRADEVIE